MSVYLSGYDTQRVEDCGRGERFRRLRRLRPCKQLPDVDRQL